MQLDYFPKTQKFTLRVPRNYKEIKSLMTEHGLDFSTSASSPSEAIMFTADPYAAATFSKHATPAAAEQIQWIVDEVESSWRKDNNGIYRVPADRELWGFQKANLAYALPRRNSLIGDQPGLGKTPTAIAFANEIRAKRVLCIVPANIRLQWCHRIREWSTELGWKGIVYPILKGKQGVHPNAEWIIVSYELARDPNVGAALAKQHYDLLIIDEAHYAKNNDSLRTHAIFGDSTGNYRRPHKDDDGEWDGRSYDTIFAALASRADRVLALTGTPLPNRPREAYTLSRGLCFDAIDWMSEDKFRARFNPAAMISGRRKDGSKYSYKREEIGRTSELQNRLRANYMTRHEKHGENGVMGQLKLPIYDIVVMDETKAVKQALQAESMLDIDAEDEDIFANKDDAVMGAIAAVRHQMGVALAPLAAEYCSMILDGGEDKICIFAWHIAVLDILQHRLEKYGVLRIDGSVSPQKRQHYVDEYIRVPSKRVMLGNIQSIGTGTDGLQEVCSRLVFPEQSWVSGENQQGVDRLDRGGQKRTVLADFLVAEGSLGERILSSSLTKAKQTHKVLDSRSVHM
tara:strand:- start:1238 stop:2953 length:1716 start_codon:yes stop_codon:yes gene_type:complete